MYADIFDLVFDKGVKEYMFCVSDLAIQRRQKWTQSWSLQEIHIMLQSKLHERFNRAMQSLACRASEFILMYSVLICRKKDGSSFRLCLTIFNVFWQFHLYFEGKVPVLYTSAYRHKKKSTECVG